MKLNVSTYNIQHCVDHLHRIRTGEQILVPDKIAAVIKEMGADICALNEVYNREMLEGLTDQSKELAEKLGFFSCFAKAIDYRGFEYGNALLSRYPITKMRSVPIVVPTEKRLKERYEDRVLLISELDIDGTTVTVAVCHFGLSREEQEIAADTVIKELSVVNMPLVFMGDLNLTPDSDIIAKLREVFFDTALLSEDELLTFSSDAPYMKIDYIFTNSHCKPLSARVPTLVCSDHLPVSAEIEI